MRALHVGKLEKEYQKLEKRFIEVTNPIYLSGLQVQLQKAKEAHIAKLAQIKELEISQKNLDHKISK